MLTDFTNKQASKAARLTEVARALGAAIAKRLDAWLLTWANLLPAGFTPLSLRPGWTCFCLPRPAAGASPLLNPAATPLVSAYLDPPPKECRDRTVLTAPFNTVEHRRCGHESLLGGPAAAGGRCRAARICFVPLTSASRRVSISRFRSSHNRVGKTPRCGQRRVTEDLSQAQCYYVGGARFLHIDYTGTRLFKALPQVHAHGPFAAHLAIKPIMMKRLTFSSAFVRRVRRNRFLPKK